MQYFQLVNEDNSPVPHSKEKKQAATQQQSANSGCLSKGSIRRQKYPAAWMLPYLVKNLKFLQNGVLKVSSIYLDRGNWSRGTTTSTAKSARQSSQQLAALEAAHSSPSSRLA